MRHEEIGTYAGVWIRQKHFTQIGDVSEGHKHKYDHVSLLAQGSVEVSVDGKTKIFKAPTFIIIRADKSHKLKALEVGTVWYCVFANRDIEGALYDPSKNCPMDEECHGFDPSLKKSLENISIPSEF